MRSTPGSVQSIDRVLEILETLSTAPLGMSLSDLAATTGLHISTTHRLVNVLTEHGYALKDSSSGKYRLTLRTFEIGSRVSSVWNLLSAAKPHLDELAATSQEAVHLVERDGNGIVYLYKAKPFQQLVRMASHGGIAQSHVLYRCRQEYFIPAAAPGGRRDLEQRRNPGLLSQYHYHLSRHDPGDGAHPCPGICH